MGGHYLGCKLSYGFLMAVVSAECAVVTPIACPLVEIFLRQAVSRFGHFARGLVRGVDLLRSGHYAIIAKNLQRYLPISTVLGAVVTRGGHKN